MKTCSKCFLRLRDDERYCWNCAAESEECFAGLSEWLPTEPLTANSRAAFSLCRCGREIRAGKETCDDCHFFAMTRPVAASERATILPSSVAFTTFALPGERVANLRGKPKCGCGGDKCRTTHADWCPKWGGR